MKTRVLIADDHHIVREGMLAVLSAVSNIQIVGTADSFKTTLHQLKQHTVDVLVLDINEMGDSPLMFVKHTIKAYPQLKIIIFSSSVDVAPEFLGMGVHGYLVKDDLSSLLPSAIQTVMANGQFISEEVQDYLNLAAYRGRDIPLSTRELSVLKLLSLGYSNQTIGAELDLDPRTIQNYINKIRSKIGCEERIEMANWYRRVYGVA